MKRSAQSLALSVVLGAVAAFCETAKAQFDLVVNGDFEAGNTGFESDYIFDTDLSGPPGRYAIGTNPQDFHPLFASFGDHTSGSGNMLVANGALLSDMAVWRQTISVLPGETYTFAFWAASVFTESPGNLQMLVNDVPLANIQLSTTTGLWQYLEADWNSDLSQTATLSIIDLNEGEFGNDFALDDIQFLGVPEPTTALLLVVGLGLLHRARSGRIRAA